MVVVEVSSSEANANARKSRHKKSRWLQAPAQAVRSASFSDEINLSARILQP
jgi:hypothetical protein